MVPRKIIIDTDPGVDDILAILLALSASPEKLQMLLISVTYGNIDLQNCLRNVISLFHYVDKEIAWRESVGRSLGFETLRSSKPVVVAIGPEQPLAENASMVDFFRKSNRRMSLDVDHILAAADGQDGLGGSHLSLGQQPHLTPAETWQHLLEVAETSSAPEQSEIIAKEMKNPSSLFTQSQTPAHLEILKLLRDNEANSITMVAIGPMTNLALAAAEDPETFLKVKEIVVMGGHIDQADNPALQPPSNLEQAPNIPEPPFRLTRQPPGPIRDLLNMRNQTAPVADFNTFADPIAAARVYALTSPKPHTVMPFALPLPVCKKQEEDVAPLPFLPSYPDNLSKRLNVTLFPMDITGKHVLARDDLEASLEPLLAAKSPLAEWVSAFMEATFDKLVSTSPGVSRDTVGVPVHDVLTIWYCVDYEDSKWEISEGEDLRVETVGQWTRGMFVADRRSRKRKDDDCDDGDGRLAGGNGNGNRLNRCVGSPGQDIFGGLLLKRIFGS